MRSLQWNIRLFKIYIFLNRLDMWQPIVVLFLLARGFSLTEYAIVDAVWYVSTVAFEVPTGIFTDRYGKKVSLSLAVAIQALSLFLLAFGTSLIWLVISYILWGLASSFETGTTDALVYDSLKQMDREEDYRQETGRIRMLIILAAAIGSVLAGLLGGVRLALPIILTAAIAVLLLPLTFFFREPDVVDVRQPSHWLHLKDSLRYLRQHRAVVLLLLYPAIMEAAVWGLYMFYQPLLQSYGIPVEGIGLLFFLCRLLSAAGARFSDSLYRVGGRALVYLIPLVFLVAVLCLGLFTTPWAIAAILVIYVLAGLYYPILNAQLNRVLPSGRRATIISLGSVVGCAMPAVTYPLLAWIADATSLQMGITVLGGGFCLLMAPTLALLGRERWQEEASTA